MQRDRRKRYSPARHPVAFAQGAFGAVHSGGAVAGVQLHDAAAAFFCPGHHDFCARPAAAGVAGKFGMPSRCFGHIQRKNYLKFAILENLRIFQNCLFTGGA